MELSGWSKDEHAPGSGRPRRGGHVEIAGAIQSETVHLVGDLRFRTGDGPDGLAVSPRSPQFTGASDCAQTWIVKGLLYCADAATDGAEVFKYPAGGSPIATFTGSFDVPLGVTAAKK